MTLNYTQHELLQKLSDWSKLSMRLPVTQQHEHWLEFDRQNNGRLCNTKLPILIWYNNQFINTIELFNKLH